MIKKLFPLLVVFAILSFNPIAIAENEDFVIEITKPRLIFPFTGLDVAPGEKKPIYQCYINVVSGKGNITSLSLDIQGSILGLFSNLKIEWPRGEIFENSGPVNLGTNDFKGTAYLEQGDDFNLFLTADVQKPTNDQLLENGINTSILSFESIQTSEPCSVLGDFPIDLRLFCHFGKSQFPMTRLSLLRLERNKKYSNLTLLTKADNQVFFILRPRLKKFDYGLISQ
ncbi:hypothetical protein CL633_01865 [bacterium]|nr:hypothetical protein [bacterium]